jgi:hypothetical protein
LAVVAVGAAEDREIVVILATFLLLREIMFREILFPDIITLLTIEDLGILLPGAEPLLYRDLFGSHPTREIMFRLVLILELPIQQYPVAPFLRRAEEPVPAVQVDLTTTALEIQAIPAPPEIPERLLMY